MEAEGAKTLKKAGAEETIVFDRSVDARFVGQGSETNIVIPERDFTSLAREEVRRRFDAIYERLYGRTYSEVPLEFINFKVRARLPERILQLPRLDRGVGTLREAVKGTRKAYSGIVRDFIPYHGL